MCGVVRRSASGERIGLDSPCDSHTVTDRTDKLFKHFIFVFTRL